MRAEFWGMVSSTWPAKNMMAVSIIANSSAKNSGAPRANSTAADPRRLRRNRRNTFRTEALEAAGDGIEKSLRRQQSSARKNYLKVIVEVFRQIGAGWPVPLTAH